MFKTYTLLTAALLSFSVSAQQQSTQSTDMTLPEIPIVDARTGRLTAEEIDSPIESSEALTKTTFNINDVLQQVQSSAPGLVSQDVLNKNAGSYIYKEALDSYKPSQSYDLKPYDSVIVPIGQGAMNSIITNFTMVAVKTSDKTSLFEAEDGYLYVTARTNDRVGIILFEEGVPESQVAVTLVPIDAPPAVVNLDIAISDAMKAKSRTYQKKIAEVSSLQTAQQEVAQYSSEHTQRIVQLLTPVAQGDMPSGFSLSSDIPASYRQPCAVPIYQHTGQRLMGGREVIDVVLMKNDLDRVFQVREEMCLSDDVIAVGLYRKSLLQPGEEMELYILRNKYFQRDVQRQQRRPRLTAQ